ncbi:MAG TPA: diaminopimelate epimerase [Terriglobales bacterium]|nr:diaminopimelate epimerase [Terriglobales bacterium]
MAVVPFIKASACGNDFLLVNLSDVASRGLELPDLARRMCDRHDGVGADGVEFLLPDETADADARADIRAKLINADGSFAEVSGNGTRCVAAYVVGETGKQVVSVRTDAGVKTCTLIKRDGNSFEFEAAMGEPEVGEQFSLKISSGEVQGTPVSMGNPHYVIFVRKFASGWQAEGAEISTHAKFEQGTNVEYVHVRDASNIAVRFYERGAGETKSSGTGSCAAAVASINAGKVNSPVTIHTLGGEQTVRLDGQVFLRGPAHLVCRGEFFI